MTRLAVALARKCASGGGCCVSRRRGVDARNRDSHEAWRYRDDDAGPSTSLRASPSTPLRVNAFDRFCDRRWPRRGGRCAVAGGFEHAMAFPGARQPFTLRYRR